MKFVTADTSGHVIQGYEPGKLRVDGQILSSSLLIAADRMEPWALTSVSELDGNHLRDLLNWNPDVILLGTGERQVFPPKDLRSYCAESGVGLEVMDTAAAARTFNLLSADGRRVLGALIV